MKWVWKGKNKNPTIEVPKCLDMKKEQELRKLHRQIEKLGHDLRQKGKIRWLVRYRNFYVQQNKNPSFR